MTVTIREEPIEALTGHALLSIAFTVNEIFDVGVDDAAISGFQLSRRAVDRPWVKDYDLDGDGPAQWPDRFDVSSWGLIAAYDGDDRVGGAVVAFDSDGVEMLEGRSDLAVLWDIRIAPQARSRGFGALLFRRAPVSELTGADPRCRFCCAAAASSAASATSVPACPHARLQSRKWHGEP